MKEKDRKKRRKERNVILYNFDKSSVKRIHLRRNVEPVTFVITPRTTLKLHSLSLPTQQKHTHKYERARTTNTYKVYVTVLLAKRTKLSRSVVMFVGEYPFINAIVQL